jgi:DNA-binding NarL/FixJ family response regulator
MHSKAAYIVDAFRAGATGYVTKDSTSRHLKECIETVLDGAYYLDPVLSEDVFHRILSQKAGGMKNEDRVHSLLTSREREIIRLIAEGHPIKTIAERLFISRKTVENHRANIYAKLDVHSTLELVRHAVKHGIIDIESWKS